MKTTLNSRECWLRRVLIGFAGLFAVFVGLYLLRGLDGKANFPFVVNSVTKDGLFLVLALIAAANLRRFGWLTLLVILGHVFLILTLGIMLLADETSSITTLDPLFGQALDAVCCDLAPVGRARRGRAGLLLRPRLRRKVAAPRGGQHRSGRRNAGCAGRWSASRPSAPASSGSICTRDSTARRTSGSWPTRSPRTASSWLSL